MGVRPAVLGSAIVVLLVVLLPAAAQATATDGAQVSGLVFLDLDGDGTNDGDEPGRGDVQVALRTDASILDATTTRPDGTWTFNNVQPGTYELVVEPPIDHRVTGGSLPGLELASGTAVLEVATDDIPDAGTVGMGSPVTTGPDIAATATLDRDASTPDTLQWEVAVHNLGPGGSDGPIDLRLALSSDHETSGVQSSGWDCEESMAIVLCQSAGDLPAGTSLPPLTLTTTPTGAVGTTVSVTATARMDGSFDGAPLNDEDEASTTISGDVATSDLDGDGNGDLTNTGATTTGLLVAGLLAVVLGGTALADTGRHGARRP